MIKNLKYYTFILLNIICCQDVIAPNLHSNELLEFLNLNYKTNSVLSYGSARDVLYGDIESPSNNGDVNGIYTNHSVTLPSNVDPSSYLYENGLDCEHLWPQSMGAGQSPMKSDMHHLRPCKSNVNSSRGNKPFNEINDNETNTWFRLNMQTSNIPSSFIDEYSESGSSYFEPREAVKGDVARSIFYFYTMYPDVADDNFFNTQKEILKTWHYQDPADNNELQRSWDIAAYQDNLPNPFVVDSTLIRRGYFYINVIPGDINDDGVSNVVDVVILVNHILGYQDLSPTQINQADMDNNNLINIVDVVLIIEEII